MLFDIYVSSDELERAEADELGYRMICTHPGEISVLEANETLVMDGDHVLFGDREVAVRNANEVAREGVLVGIHSCDPDKLWSLGLLRLEHLVVARTHHDLLEELGQFAKFQGGPWARVAKQAICLESEVNHVHANAEADARGQTAVPVGP